MECWRGINRNR